MRPLILAAVLAWPCISQADTTLTDVLSDKGLSGFVTVDRLPMPTQPVLAAGRVVWAETCMACHGGNKATGAPKITATQTWAPRIQQGLPTLIEHAVQGFLGVTYAEMPPRGGNPDLSDADVAAAVAFMVWASGGAEPALQFLDTRRTD
ncbi:MAG: c-type cytochrome [Pelagimonas sp.]|uniref:c-type cytochrome n=1 Tax=Pelagimonas sp. TaxID=2073170 RepID=UPI003D6C33F8